MPWWWGYTETVSPRPTCLHRISTLAGVAYTSVNKRPLIYDWEALAVLTGILCIVGGWRHAKDRGN
jgi:hypothetical protein